jgi:peptidoglycan-N-acetylglucosamine deacetylase
MPWLWLAVLLIVAIGVFAARTVKLPRGAEPAPSEATPAPLMATPRAAQVTLRPTPRPTTARTAQAISESTTREPVAAPTARVSGAATARSGSATPIPGGAGPVVGTATPAPAAGTSAAASPVVPPAAGDPAGGVALTFDAGADRGYAEDILDILHEQHVVASFGITGLWARSNPDLVRRMAADGHLVFNHTLDHRSFTGASDGLGGLSAAARRAELDDADAIIAPLIGHTTRPFYRLPYGDDDAHVALDVAADGYAHKVGWTVDSLGWRGAQSADIVARCLKLAAAGGVYVFHVGRASQDAIALPRVIAGLRDRGLSFRRVDQA